MGNAWCQQWFDTQFQHCIVLQTDDNGSDDTDTVELAMIYLGYTNLIPTLLLIAPM